MAIRACNNPRITSSILSREITTLVTERAKAVVAGEGGARVSLVRPSRRTVEWLKGAVRTGRRARLKVVFQRPLGSRASFVAKEYLKSDADAALINAALDANVVFHDLPATQRDGLIPAFKPVAVAAGAAIVTEGNYCHVVGTGTVAFAIGGREVGSAGAGGKRCCTRVPGRRPWRQ